MDRRSLDLHLARFEALKTNIPSFIKEDFVAEYNSLVDDLGKATGEDFAMFRVVSDEVKHKSVGSRPRSYTGRTGQQAIYSKDKYCDDDLFNRRIESLSHFLESSGFRRTQPMKEQVPSAGVRVGTMINSAIQHSSPHGTVNLAFDIRGPEFTEFLNKLKAAITRIDIPREQQTILQTDIATIEVQIVSPAPKKGVISECGASIRTIFEGVASNLIASGLLPLILHYFPKI